ncbi:interleukin-17F-like [Liolophura sinensis]|uniref:interleukin-17F-like n=1 Tax=Liolophura sinensis TaxID=3198878 RepID=UPI0031596CC8
MCEEPPDLDRLKETLGNYDVHESKYLNPLNYNDSRLNIHQAGRRRGLAEMRREASCPRYRGVLRVGPVNSHERSLCPWTYTTHRDPDRIPETITEVVCQCHKCLLYKTDGTRDDTMRCKPVYYYIRALRRSSYCTVTENGGLYYQYNRVLEPVKVACTCVSPLVNVSHTSPESRITPRP